MINVRIIRRAKSQTGTGAGTAYSGGTVVIAGTVDEAKHAYVADRAGSAEYADKSGYADTAGTATRAHTADNLADDFEYPDRWIRNDESDTASGDLYTFEHDVTVTEDTVHGGTTTHNGQTTHNARAVFKQHFDLPNESVGRIAGTLHFANTIEQAGTAQPNGSISGTGIAQMKKMTLTGPDTAGQYDTLDVTGTSIMRDIIGPYPGSVRFEDGFTGHGFRIWKDENNAYHITADFLTIRQQMKVFELLIQKIRSTAGSIVVSDANGKIKRVEEMTIASENDTWLIWFETDHDFAPGDIMRVQSWKGLGTSAGSYENTSWWGVVGAVQTIDGEKVVLMSKSTWSGSVPKEGDEVVQWGNTGTTVGRDKILYITAAENDPMGISMYEDVNTINGGRLTLKIGDLSGINDSVFGQLSGWGLYAQSVYLRSDNIVGSDGKTISQRFQVADGKLESSIDGMRAKTSGDSIVKNHDLSDVTDNYPDYWHPYNIDGTPLSDTTSILSDGHTALGAYGTGEAYTAYFDDGVNRYLRIINTGESADCGIYQDVSDMRQDLWASGETRTAKNVSFSFRYRMTAGSEMSVYFHSGFMSREGVCDSSVTSDTYTIYGLKKALTADGKWHTATYFGTYVGGSGQLRFLVNGTADVTDVECLVAEELQYTNSRFVQTDERITAEVSSITSDVSGLTTRVGTVEATANNVSARVASIVQDPWGNLLGIQLSDLVLESEFATLFSSNVESSNLVDSTAMGNAINNALIDYVTDDEFNTELDKYARTDWTEGRIQNATSGMVTKSNMATMFSGYWDTTDPQNPVFKPEAVLTTFLYTVDSQTGEKTIKGGIKMQADQILQLAEKIQAVAREMKFTADNIKLEGYTSINGGFNVDTEGNVQVMGVVNNGVLEIDQTNIDNYVSTADEGGKRYFDALRLPATVVLSSLTDRSIYLPCAYFVNGGPLPTGKTKFKTHHTSESTETGGWYINNIADLRSMVGKKIHFINSSDDNTVGIGADLLVRVEGQEVDYETGVTPSLNSLIEPDIKKYWQCVPNGGQPLGVIRKRFADLECKTGKWNGYECIYWEITYSGEILEE